MSLIEETLSRMEHVKNVEGYLITDKEGQILRYSSSFAERDMQGATTGSPTEFALHLAAEMLLIVNRARHMVRDLDPLNDLDFFRIRVQDREIITSPGENFIVSVVQHLAHPEDSEYHHPNAPATRMLNATEKKADA